MAQLGPAEHFRMSTPTFFGFYSLHSSGCFKSQEAAEKQLWVPTSEHVTRSRLHEPRKGFFLLKKKKKGVS